MTRKTIQITTLTQTRVLALCDDGSMWHGEVASTSDGFKIAWKPIDGPPSGTPDEPGQWGSSKSGLF